jgi:hypothetical protein
VLDLAPFANPDPSATTTRDFTFATLPGIASACATQQCLAAQGLRLFTWL